MNKRIRTGIGIAAGICLCLGLGIMGSARVHSLPAGAAQAGQQAAPKENVVTTHATGAFDVNLAPQAAEPGADASLGRMTIDKQYHGDLEGRSVGQMLTGITDVKGSAGYVAIERVTGKLHGRSGSFTLQHSGIMAHGDYQLNVTIVPDSGAGELAGIMILPGSFKINIDAAGKHSYEFDYTLPAAH
jgi:hypothetical protein